MYTVSWFSLLFFSARTQNTSRTMQRNVIQTTTANVTGLSLSLFREIKCNYSIQNLSQFVLLRMISSTVLQSTQVKGTPRDSASWAIESEPIRARGIIVLVKSNQLVKNIENSQLIIFCRQKARAFRHQQAITYSLVVAQPIRTQH